MTINEIIEQNNEVRYPGYVNILLIVLAIILFLFSIVLMVSSINSLGFSFANYAVNATANPFVGLFIGLLATAIVQSSSTTTTMIVAGVASGTLSLEGAIPVIMGANIGTTLTSTIVSMGYINKTNEFRKAVAAGTVHDFFNILMVIILFPIEMKYHILEKGSKLISGFFGSGGSQSMETTHSLSSFFGIINNWLISHTSNVFTLILAVILLLACIKFISKLLYDILIGKAKKKFETTVFSTTFRSFGWGLFLTSVAQSSSLTTSLIVPLVATGKVNINRAFQFILGANIGTTITALLAALFHSEAAVDIALVHLLFNTVGVIIFLGVPFLFRIPVFLASKMGEYTLKRRIVGFAYIFITFFLLPFTLIYASRGFDKKADPVEVSAED